MYINLFKSHHTDNWAYFVEAKYYTTTFEGLEIVKMPPIQNDLKTSMLFDWEYSDIQKN